MKRMLCLAMVSVIAWLSLAACGQAGPLSPGPEPKKPAAATPAAPGTGWEEKWNSVVAKGKQEGAVTIYTHWIPKARVALNESFKQKYGINLEFSTFTGGADMLARANAEKRAGLYAADMFGSGNTTLLISMKPEGLLGSIEPLLILPEVLDPKVWLGGKVPLSDKEGMALSMSALAMHMIVYNTNLVKDGEITSYMDLLKPQYKGKVIMHDPSVTGSGNAAITHVGNNLWGESKTEDFLRRLIKEQEAVVLRDYRVHMESVARGKHAVGLAPSSDIMAEFLAVGAPVKMANVEEDNILTASSGAFGVPAKFAHPNAATVFVNWLLSREGQTLFARSVGNPSRRVDVPAEGIDPLFVPVPGKQYWGESDEALAARGKWRDIAKRIVEETTR